MTTTPFAEPTRGSHAAALLLCRCGVEIWRTTYESDAYEVSNLGRIRRATTKRVLEGHVNQMGYKEYRINRRKCQSHRTVAHAFIPNPDEKPTVDHYRSSEKLNNKLTNLRWATGAEQNANTERPATCENGRRPVRMLDKDTREFIRRFDSVLAAGRHLNKDPVNIGAVLRGRLKTALGYAWEYEPPETIRGEEWRQIPREVFDLQEPHEVSSHGRIKNLTSGRVRSGSTQNSGVIVCSLKLTDGRTRAIRLARVVASVFLQTPENKPVVMHIDGDKANNHVSNLAWATQADVNHASHDRGASNSWTEEEDAALRDFVKSADRDHRGRIEWKDTALPEILQKRTTRSVIQRAHSELLSTRAEVSAWTEEEDAALRDFAESADRDNRGRIIWKDTTLPEILQNRTVDGLRYRLHRLSQSGT